MSNSPRKLSKRYQKITSNFLRPAGLRRSAFAAQTRLASLRRSETCGFRSLPLRTCSPWLGSLPPLRAAGEVPPSHGGWEALRLPDPPRCHQTGSLQPKHQRARGRPKEPVERLREGLRPKRFRGYPASRRPAKAQREPLRRAGQRLLPAPRLRRWLAGRARRRLRGHLRASRSMTLAARPRRIAPRCPRRGRASLARLRHRRLAKAKLVCVESLRD